MGRSSAAGSSMAMTSGVRHETGFPVVPSKFLFVGIAWQLRRLVPGERQSLDFRNHAVKIPTYDALPNNSNRSASRSRSGSSAGALGS